MASELSGWHYLRYEIFEAPENGTDGSLFMFIPELGIYRGTVGPHGDIVLTEHQISGLVRDSKRETDLVTKIENALGRPWNEELECYRRAIADGASARQIGRAHV